jgi:hypothetical protein
MSCSFCIPLYEIGAIEGVHKGATGVAPSGGGQSSAFLRQVGIGEPNQT